MPTTLPREDRLRLMKFVCSFAWADLEIHVKEREFVGKMISPQNLTIAATAVGLVGRESDILRKVLPWSIGLIIAMCLLVGLQSTVLAWMLP